MLMNDKMSNVLLDVKINISPPKIEIPGAIQGNLTGMAGPRPILWHYPGTFFTPL